MLITHGLSQPTAHLPLTLCTLGSSAPNLGGVVDTGSCGTKVVLHVTANQPEFMNFHNTAKVQKGADVARMDACLSTEAADQNQLVYLASELTEVRF